jgi:predicted acylesterase/phospholipase RssA
MASSGPTLRVSSRSVGRTLGEEHAQARISEPNHIRLMHWLDEQEARHQYVVYEADAAATAWTGRCIRAADRVVVVGRADADPAPGEIERAISACAAGTTKQSLVLLHAPHREKASGTARWLASRPTSQHFHVRHGRQGDVERLARILTGRAVGLVLGGGGARGFAHVGVIKALAEAGIPIDVVGGTSMGAMIAAQHAAEWAPETMLARTIEGAKKAFDPTFPLVSLIAGRKAGTMLRRFVGDTQIEDLWLPFFCVSTNLTRGHVNVHRRGSLLKGLLASNAAPGIYPPVVEDGDLLVDGALLNNLPVDVMQTFAGGGTIIAVDVCPPVDLDQNVDYGMGLSGWRAFWNRINPISRAAPFPSIASILMRSTMLGSVSHHNAVVTSLADLHLRPPVDRFPFHAYAAGRDVARVGYQFARERLAEWRPAF